jgi:2-hydroxycyclohexanecarboxyl-CoA dehydrogenase
VIAMNGTESVRAVVTGGASGIGAAIVRALIIDRMSVTFCDCDEVTGQRLAEDTGASFVAMDATDLPAVTELFRVSKSFDVLVNNVGVDQHVFFTEVTPSDWRRLLAVNLETTFAFTQAALPAMQSAGYGRIVNIASEAGRLGSRGGAVYAAAKAGVIGFTRSIARENARYGITCNAVLPGPIQTSLVDKAIADHGEKLKRDMENLTLVRRLGRPEEVAAAVSFLASPTTSFITGEALGVSGGMGCGVG